MPDLNIGLWIYRSVLGIRCARFEYYTCKFTALSLFLTLSQTLAHGLCLSFYVLTTEQENHRPNKYENTKINKKNIL